MLSTLYSVDQRNAQYYAHDTDGYLGCAAYHSVWARYYWSKRYSGCRDVFDPYLPPGREDWLAQAMYPDERECTLEDGTEGLAHPIRSCSLDLYPRRPYRITGIKRNHKTPWSGQ